MSAGKDISYFKARAVLKSTWTLEEAAYLLCGHNPIDSKLKISPTASNSVSNLYYRLKTKVKSGDLRIVIRGDAFKPKNRERRLDRYSVDQVFDLMKKEKIKPDPDLHNLRKRYFKDRQNTDPLTRIIYQEAARLLSHAHPSLDRQEIAEILHELPDKLEGHLELRKIEPAALESLIRGITHRESGARSKAEREKAQKEMQNIKWKYMIENILK